MNRIQKAATAFIAHFQLSQWAQKRPAPSPLQPSRRSKFRDQRQPVVGRRMQMAGELGDLCRQILQRLPWNHSSSV